MWQQLRQPNLNIAYTGGLCLQAVREAFWIPLKYGTAIEDWNSGNKRQGYPPAGIAVPVYFTLSKVPAGHVAIWLPDGRIASSSKAGTHRGLYIHPNVADLVRMYSTKANGTCRYLGWSTEVNDIPVVAERNEEVTQVLHDKEMNDLRRFYEGVMVDSYIEAIAGEDPKKYSKDARQHHIDYITHNPGGQIAVMKGFLKDYGWSRGGKSDNAGIIAKLQSMIDSLRGGA